MKKEILGFLAVGLLLAAPAMGQEVPQNTEPAYNCDFQPSCEVAPGVYGKMASPVKSKFNLSIGGFVKLDYAYNSVDLGNSGALTPGSGAIPKTTSTAGQSDQSIFTARQSRIWLKVAGPSLLGAKTSALVEMDFYGDPSAAAESPQIRMRQAWGAIDWKNTGILFGQAYDVFGPMISSTIDFRSGAAFGAPNNPRVPQLRLTQKVALTPANSLKLVLGLQDPNQNANNNAVADNKFGTAVNVAAQAMFVSKALGVAPGYWGLSMKSLTAGVFGLIGSEKVALATGNKTVDSWGYGVYTFVPVLKSKDGKGRAMTMSLEGQAYMAANMAFNSATASTFVGDPTNPNAAKGYGLNGQVIFYPTQDLGITAGYGRRNAYNYADYQTTANFQKSSTNIYANVAYDLNAAIRVAAEYQNVNTQYGNNTPGTSGTGTANIGRFSLMYFF
ncbi:MAG: hypothetical protein WCA04_05400 [Geobacteraceae bacterium]